MYCLSGDSMIIEKVKINNRDVSLYLSNNEVLVILIDTYLNSNILIGDEIDEKKIEFLKKKNEIYEIRSKLLLKLSKKRLSKKECEEILLYNGLELDVTNKILMELENKSLINDRDLAEDIIHYAFFNKKGINLIYKKLIDRGIYMELSEIYKFIDNEKYLSNIQYLIDKYKNHYKNKSNKVLYQNIKNKLMENGYNKHEFESLLQVNDHNEYDAVRREIERFFKNRDISGENIAKITKKLLSKGFNYDIIKDALGSVNV